MLDPRQRALLLESLRPPLGYTLDRAVGTTYSLDLLALLTAPLAFTSFEAEDDDGPTRDPLSLLEALRENADRLVLFCQAGQIRIPPKEQRLLAYLEQAIVEVKAAQDGGVFHPKLWVLRFASSDGPGRYRLLCLTRNLTFDRSWDVALSLDGEVVERKNAFAANRPLVAFVGALPTLAVRPVSQRIVDTVAVLQDELVRVRFERPEGVEELAFWPLGLPGMSRWPFRGRTDRLLVVSPFLSEGCLQRLVQTGTEHVLVSRDEALSALRPDLLGAFTKTYTLSDRASSEPEDEEPAASPLDDDDVPTGLHAKLYIADVGRDARLWIGSANATSAAFDRNVEFLVELGGKKSRYGIDAFLLGDGEGQGFLPLLDPYVSPPQPLTPDPEAERLRGLLEEARRALASAPLRARVAAEPDGQRYRMVLETAQGFLDPLPAGTTATVWPVTLRKDQAQPVGAGTATVADFGVVSFEAVTAFFAFEVSATHAGGTLTLPFAVNVPLVGTPEDRYQRVLLSLLDDSSKLMRFLLLLLAATPQLPGLLPPGPATPGGDVQRGAGAWGSSTLLESLLRALDRAPEKLDHIAGLVADLRATEDGRRLLPAGFDAVWDPIWAARVRVRR